MSPFDFVIRLFLKIKKKYNEIKFIFDISKLKLFNKN
jgi:hypothetical protein